MSSFFKQMEKNIGRTSDNALEIALHYYGQELCLFRADKSDVFARVHNKNAGGDLHHVCNFIGIIQSDDFSTSDGNYSVNMQEGFLFTKNKDVKTGDVIKINAGGGYREFLVDEMLDIGYTTDMFIKYKLVNRN